jgi:SAM-dependent methyltransferase
MRRWSLSGEWVSVPRAMAAILRRTRARIPARERLRFRQAVRRVLAPVRLGVFRAGVPVSESWGYDRGTPVDRVYIHRFLNRHREAITGRVLEVHDDRYTKRFGRAVERSDVLDIDPANPGATLIGDLAAPDAFEPDVFDCFVLTQTLQFVYDLRTAVKTVRRVLRPGGVVLATVPAASRISRGQVDREFWRFTGASLRRLFADEFGGANVEVAAHGNSLTVAASIVGLAFEELPRPTFDVDDEHFPLIVAVRAVK